MRWSNWIESSFQNCSLVSQVERWTVNSTFLETSQRVFPTTQPLIASLNSHLHKCWHCDERDERRFSVSSQDQEFNWTILFSTEVKGPPQISHKILSVHTCYQWLPFCIWDHSYTTSKERNNGYSACWVGL